MYLISGNITSNVTGNLLVITGNGNIGNITSNFRTLNLTLTLPTASKDNLAGYRYNADLRIATTCNCGSKCGWKSTYYPLAHVAYWALTNHASVTLLSWKNVICFNLLAVSLYYFCTIWWRIKIVTLLTYFT